MKNLDDMTVEELISLSKEVALKIAMKQYGHGYKDGTEDAKKAEQERHVYMSACRKEHDDGKG